MKNINLPILTYWEYKYTLYIKILNIWEKYFVLVRTYLVHSTPCALLSNVEVLLISLLKTGKIPPIMISPCRNKLGMSNLPSTSQPQTMFWQRATTVKTTTVCSSGMFAERVLKGARRERSYNSWARYKTGLPIGHGDVKGFAPHWYTQSLESLAYSSHCT